MLGYWKPHIDEEQLVSLGYGTVFFRTGEFYLEKRKLGGLAPVQFDDAGDKLIIDDIDHVGGVILVEIQLYFASPYPRNGPDLWALSLDDGTEVPLTDFAGRPGELGGLTLDTDGEYLYFTWQEDLGDIWVMDVVED